MTVYADETPTRDRVPTLAGTVWQATFAEDAPAVGVPARVLLDSWRGAETWGPSHWPIRDLLSATGTGTGSETDEGSGAVTVAVTLTTFVYRLPKKGDPCVVVFDDVEVPTVIAWRPA